MDAVQRNDLLGELDAVRERIRTLLPPVTEPLDPAIPVVGNHLGVDRDPELDRLLAREAEIRLMLNETDQTPT